MTEKEIYFITSNRGKIEELSALLEPLGYTVIQWDIGYPEVQVDTLEEVVGFALEYLTPKMKGQTMIEDAGLFIDSLGGFPGVYSAFVQKTIGNEGVLRILRDTLKDGRGAVFRACLGFMVPGKEKVVICGECRGSISMDMRGDGGFGFDPIFIPDGFDITFAQMEKEEKNRISHRGKVTSDLIRYLEERSSGQEQ